MNPRISIITCSYNQGQFIERTIQSVLQQKYNNIEHIVVDGMSSDNTLSILEHYPHLTVIREPDRGQADAINKGLIKATGDIITFLNSDDTLALNALQCVAKELNPLLNKHIVMGRCQFVDENDQFSGIEHPSFFINHATVLSIWKGHFIPQPAVFWSREVLNQCGLLNINEHAVLDYDLFCRYSKKYYFYCINQVLAHYRLHTQSKTHALTNQDRLEHSIRVSKQYWGSKKNKLYWQLWFSLNNFRRKNYARSLFKDIKKTSWQKPWRNIQRLILSLLIGFDIIFYRIINPGLKIFIPLSYYQKKWLKQYPQIMAYLDYKNKWSDDWIGPHFEMIYSLQESSQRLKIQGTLPHFFANMKISIYIDSKLVAIVPIKRQNNFELEVTLSKMYVPKNYKIQINTDNWFIMHHYNQNEDYRPLSWKLFNIMLI